MDAVLLPPGPDHFLFSSFNWERSVFDLVIFSVFHLFFSFSCFPWLCSVFSRFYFSFPLYVLSYDQTGIADTDTPIAIGMLHQQFLYVHYIL